MPESISGSSEAPRDGAHPHHHPGAARPPATISVDLDSAATHLRGYGERPSRDDALLEVALPRLLQLFEELAIRATLFVVAGDAPADGLLRAAADRHEIAAHSVTHPMPFARLGSSRLEAEVRNAKARLEDRIGSGVYGFRAPNWDTSPAVWEALAAAGYRYDASLLPTPWQIAIRAVLALGSRSLRPLVAMRPVPARWARLPHLQQTDHGSIWQFPVATTPRIRFPVYHTVRYRMSSHRFQRIVAALATRGEPFGYALHAVDLVSLDDAGIPSSMRRHPGMDMALDAKLALLRASLATVTEHFRTVAYIDQVSGLESQRR
jgi:peptidoglycan/xylan/chitin deacetylase (PgdA/CDA1 family)